MGPVDRRTAERAAPERLDRAVLCGSVLFGGVAFVVELPGFGAVVIGRDADVDLQLGDGSVSRRHAVLDVRADHATVTDADSRNGTFVNGERIDGPRRVAQGDEIALGSARIALLARPMVPAGARPVLVRCALLERLDTELAQGRDVDVVALRMPGPWHAIDGIARWLGALPDEAYVGMLSEQALVVAGANADRTGAVAALRPEALDIQVGMARARESSASAGIELVNAALRAIGAVRAPVRIHSRVVAASAPMLALYDEAAKIAPSIVSVLVLGETGAGKEVLARFIHERSGRRGPLVGVNTAALPEALVESELFGHERGAFSGAHQAKIGLIEAAHGGTLFLDEIGDLPLGLQAKLLRVLEERSVRRVGATIERKIDVRIVAATHRDLDRAVAEGTFRRDLLFRLNACPLAIPPLRRRLDEIEPLADELLAAAGTPRTLAAATIERLRAHDWPGNVRELRNVLDRAAALAGSGGVLLPEHLPAYLTAHAAPRSASVAPAPAASVAPPASIAPHGAPSPSVLPDAIPKSAGGEADIRDDVKEYERKRIVDALARTNGNQSQAAKLLGLPRRTLAYRMARLGIPTPE